MYGVYCRSKEVKRRDDSVKCMAAQRYAVNARKPTPCVMGREKKESLLDFFFPSGDITNDLEILFKVTAKRDGMMQEQPPPCLGPQTAEQMNKSVVFVASTTQHRTGLCYRMHYSG